MYNHQLDTFLLTAKVGSFSAAAEKLYISPSAVNQQITALEVNLNLKLFERSNHGLRLTAAGQLLVDEAPSYIAHAAHLRSQLENAANDKHEILVGIPHMHNIRLFYEYWTAYSAKNPPVSVKLASPDTWNVPDVFRFYASCDIVEYVDIWADWMKGRSFIKLMDMPVAFAVPRSHPLAALDRFSISDLKGAHIVAARGAFVRTISPGLNLIESKGAVIHYDDHYSPEMLENCLLNNYMTVVLQLDPKIPASFKVIPCEWGVTVPYGFSVKKTPSPSLERFLSFVTDNLHEE